MAIQWDEEIPGVCQNKDCNDFKAFEKYYAEDVLKDKFDKKDYVKCRECGARIYLD